MDQNETCVIRSFNVSPHIFGNTLSQRMLHSFCISHVNIRSLNKNFENLYLLHEDTLRTKFIRSVECFKQRYFRFE